MTPSTLPPTRRRIARLLGIALACLAPAVAFAETALRNVPLPDLGMSRYLGQFTGGLYPSGSNSIPPDHWQSGVARAQSIQPLDASGNPDPSGQYVLISIGVSNTTQEFCHPLGSRNCNPWTFMGQAAADPSVNNTTLRIVNGAQGGREADNWESPDDQTYNNIRARLTDVRLTEAQVQIVWVKLADNEAAPSLPNALADAYVLESRLGNVTRAIKVRYPNVKLVFFSSRIYGGYAGSGIRAEPYSYEGGFAVKWLIEAQIAQMRRGGTVVDARAGDLNYQTVAPWIAWGPYLWADGANAPRSDGLIYERADLDTDAIHPSQSGETKVADQLMAFFKTHPLTHPWFLRQSSIGAPPACAPAANVTAGPAPLSVDFTAHASDADGAIIDYAWTFDDGTFSTAANPTKRFPAPGTYNARLTVTDDSGNAVQRSVAINVTQTLSAWKSVHFTAAELADANISGDLADIDRDGLRTLEEYSFGLNPKLADAAAVSIAAASADQHLTLTFPRAKFAADTRVTVEAASEVTGPWSSGPNITSEQVIADDGVVQTILATDLAPMSAAATRFMRLRIDKLSPPAATAFHTATMTPQQSTTRALEP